MGQMSVTLRIGSNDKFDRQGRKGAADVLFALFPLPYRVTATARDEHWPAIAPTVYETAMPPSHLIHRDQAGRVMADYRAGRSR